MDSLSAKFIGGEGRGEEALGHGKVVLGFGSLDFTERRFPNRLNAIDQSKP
jgi:hypothetical protein